MRKAGENCLVWSIGGVDFPFIVTGYGFDAVVLE